MKAIENEEILQTYIFITHRLNTLHLATKFSIKRWKYFKPLTFNEIKNSALFEDQVLSMNLKIIAR